MAALNRNYEFKKIVIIECRNSFFFFLFKNIVWPLDHVVWVGRNTAPFPFTDDLLNQTDYNMAEK